MLASVTIQASIGALTGAAIGGVFGGIDSRLGGGSFWESFKNGAVTGALFGTAAGVLGPIFAQAKAGTMLARLGGGLAKVGVGANVAGTIWSAGESWYNGRGEQGFFRLGSGLFAFGFTQQFVGRLVRWAKPSLFFSRGKPAGVATDADILMTYLESHSRFGRAIVKWIDKAGYRERLHVHNIPYERTGGGRGYYTPQLDRIDLYGQSAESMDQLAIPLVHEFIHAMITGSKSKANEFWTDVVATVGMGESNIFGAAYRRIIELVGNPAYETLPVFFNGDTGAGMTALTFLQDYDG